MNGFDDGLRDALRGAAVSIAPDQDLDDLTRRIARRERRRGVLVASVCVVVVLGAVGVTALVVHRDPASPAPTAGGAENASPGGESIVVGGGKRPTVPASALGSGSRLVFTSRPPQMLGSRPLGLTGDDGAIGEPGVPGPAGLLGASPAMPLAKSFTRSTGDGTIIRVYRADVSPPVVSGPPWFTPAAWCAPSGVVQADVSDDAVAGVTQGVVYSQLREGVVGGSVGLVGSQEQHPVWVVIAQVPEDAVSVRATFPSGATDTMKPVDGVAVLVESGSANDQTLTVTVDALGARGNPLGSKKVNSSDPQEAYGPEWNKACSAPAQLPPPGPHQPADPAAAKQAVSDLFALAWSAHATDAERFSAFEDSHGFDQAMREVRTGPQAAQANSEVTATVDGIVFLSPTEAAAAFTFNIANYGRFGGFFGEAVRRDGAWKLTRSTFCNALATTNARCPA